MFAAQLPLNYQPSGVEYFGLQHELIHAFQYRNSRTGNRQTRTTHLDHDVFEGLPVRHWTKKPLNVNAAAERDTSKPTGITPNGYPELLLPRDFSMLPENSQALLRAARMGPAKRPREAEDEKENDENEHSEVNGNGAGFLMTKWSLLPREHDSEPSYLAKRRKGLPSAYGSANNASGADVLTKKVKIKRTDNDGIISVWEVLVPEGQAVEGEIIEDDASPTTAIPGAIIEGLGVVNAEGLVIAGDQPAPTPVRRRPPIPKKKKKHGPGRGRKKIVEQPPGESGESLPNGETTVNGNDLNDQGALSRDQDEGHGSREDSVTQDAHQDDDEGSEEGSEEGDDDREEGELSPSPGEVEAAKQDRSSRSKTPAVATPLPLPENAHTSDNPDAANAVPSPQDGEASAPDVKIELDEKASSPPISPQSEHMDRDPIMQIQRTEDKSQSPTSDKSTDDEMMPRSSTYHVYAQPIRATAKLEVSVPLSTPSPEVPPISDTSLNVSSKPPPSLGPLVSPQQTPDPDTMDMQAPPPLESGMASPPPIPQAISKSPEPPSSLPPHRQPSPPAQRIPQPPASYPPEQSHRTSVSTPKAPTPSPPTPIEAAFAAGLSPKAPTMSPPTPIPQDLDTSGYAEPPPLSLSESQEKPPPTFIPGLQSFPPPRPHEVAVEAAPYVQAPHYNAEIPHAHNPLDGLAPPEAPPADRSLDTLRNSSFFSGDEAEIEGLNVEAAPQVDDPNLDADIPHTHDPLDGLKAPDIPPKQRRLERTVEGEYVASSEEEDENLP